MTSRATPPMYITKASHFKGALGNATAPKPAQEVAQFINWVKSSSQGPLTASAQLRTMGA